ncbi:hypothetical protein RI103_03870 [Paraburkholderia sp. FT54]|uniref:hypothetical protein n=1 Tax=Paraburkholderia sp. FT54 TaxID=3074437 RepID=UPI0028775521|nr:hypothetical protein [Paraburkholderia sp. FT54]WNC90512.1 hypothetical protein RI103_03870 [Paraburkholderia sp. FT54]
MSKLFYLKEWVTVLAAANHLSAVFGENVAEADILQFALDGRLTLSVHFVNPARARYGHIVGPEGIEWMDLPNVFGIGGPRAATHIRHMRSLKLYDDRDEYINLSEDVISIDGVWDLPMLGGDRLDVEHTFQMLISGHAVTSSNLEGSFVKRGDLVCQIQESTDDNEYVEGSNAQLKTIKQLISEEKLPTEKGEALLKLHAEKRKEFLAHRTERPASDHYYPAGGLPTDCNLVVRTSNLASFIQSVSAPPEEVIDSLGNKERTSLQKQIAALALALAEKSNKYRKGDTPNANQIAETVLALVDEMRGANTMGISSTSIRNSIAAGIKLLKG